MRSAVLFVLMLAFLFCEGADNRFRVRLPDKTLGNRNRFAYEPLESNDDAPFNRWRKERINTPRESNYDYQHIHEDSPPVFEDDFEDEPQAEAEKDFFGEPSIRRYEWSPPQEELVMHGQGRDPSEQQNSIRHSGQSQVEPMMHPGYKYDSSSKQQPSIRHYAESPPEKTYVVHNTSQRRSSIRQPQQQVTSAKKESNVKASQQQSSKAPSTRAGRPTPSGSSSTMATMDTSARDGNASSKAVAPQQQFAPVAVSAPTSDQQSQSQRKFPFERTLLLLVIAFLNVLGACQLAVIMYYMYTGDICGSAEDSKMQEGASSAASGIATPGGATSAANPTTANPTTANPTAANPTATNPTTSPGYSTKT